MVGLPGDAEHRELFSEVTETWKTWLTDELKFAEENVVVLDGRGKSDQPNRSMGTRDRLEHCVGELVEQSGEEDSLWVFFLAT